jgi:transglutaminase-like putative cysteine protease
MTAPATPATQSVDVGAFIRRIQLRPVEGWLTVAMVGLLVATLPWSINDAAWVPPSEGSTDYLVWLALGGAAFGLLGAKVGLGRWKTNLLGAIVAGLVLPLIAGNIVLGSSVQGIDPASLWLRYQAAGTVAFRVWVDLARDNKPFTTQYGHYHMVFGAIVWAAGLLAATAVFARRRPLDAIVVVGLLLLASMSVTNIPQLNFLVFFSIAALVLLIRSHALEEQVTWVRRRIGDPAAVAALYLRGGGSFITAAVLGALILTAAASSAPLQGFWADVPQKLVNLSQWIQKFAPPGGDPRSFTAVGFGSSATTNGLWSPSSAVAFRVQLAPGEKGGFKWVAGTYSTYDGVSRWSWGDTASADHAANTSLLLNTLDDPALDLGRRTIQATITPDAFGDSTIVSGDSIQRVDRPTVVRLDGGRFVTVEPTGGSGPYIVTSLIPDIGGATGLTQNRLRVAGRAYPADIVAHYTNVPQNAIGPNALAILTKAQQMAVEAGGSATNPFDLAHALETYLQSSVFTYSPDVREKSRVFCGGIQSTVECFATMRTGYCEYYASTMAILLRQANIPTRIAYGFLGAPAVADGTEVIQASAAHWWVEVYFPSYGWVEFDPTGTVGEPVPLPSGPPETPRPSASHGPLGTLDAGGPENNRHSAEPVGVAGTTDTGPGPFIAIALLLILGVGAVALAAFRRAPRKPMHPDQAWGSLGRLAARFGLGPRPSQTVYEYAGMLGEAVPAVRAELSTVARAKVEVAYGRQELGVDRLRLVGEAYRRLRVAIVRQAFGRLRRRR